MRSEVEQGRGAAPLRRTTMRQHALQHSTALQRCGTGIQRHAAAQRGRAALRHSGAAAPLCRWGR
jgi:hypothetical protein